MRRTHIALILAGLALLCVTLWLYTPDKPRAALEAQYATPPSTFVNILGVRLHLRDTGPRDAPAILFLHGFGASLQTWDRWAQALDPTYRIIRFDLPGFGLTGADPSGDYSDARSIAVVLGLMDRLGVHTATVVGHSMGGRIAWTLAALHPDRVEKLVLMAPDGFASPGLAYGVAPAVPWMMRLLPYMLPIPLLRATLAPAYADRAAMTDALVARYRDMMRAPGVRRAILDRMPQTILVPPEPLLARIHVPTLLLWGERDAMVPITNAADYLRSLPNARLVKLDGVGHLPQEEAPDHALDALRPLLEQR